jgi:hypothetical protein
MKRAVVCGETYLDGSKHETGKFLYVPLKDPTRRKESGLGHPIRKIKGQKRNS